MIQCSWSPSTLVTWCKERTHRRRPWCWERLRAGEDDRGWDGWTASPTQRTWTWASSWRQWRTGGLGSCSLWGCKEPDTTRRLTDDPCLPSHWRPRSTKAKVYLPAQRSHPWVQHRTRQKARTRQPTALKHSPLLRDGPPRAACVQHNSRDPAHSKPLLGRFSRHTGSYLCPRDKGRLSLQKLAPDQALSFHKESKKVSFP